MSQNQQIKFVKQLTRASKAPFETISTSLWLANVISADGEPLILDYSRYLYIHRDAVGKITGISISKTMVGDHLNVHSQYIEYGDLMFGILIFYIEEIESFCQLWANEFEKYFLLPPDDYFEAASWRWNSIVKSTEV
ncbi:hypothetical protein [Pseudoalteromonas sp. 2CM28B]|uniref:hypothetical protein n=1 Tax=Pseudoalteromonas sp. 2CM28B TaxID=2929851 RepID=UPI0020BDD2DB|nr:hypothetical protein [Pseudoalteromonas sp. 2CM28B]MCK8134696.1 hypothetical protein [Pseudoalteromonas sp. 2CM28B]